MHNVIYNASLNTNFIRALTQFIHDQGLMTPDVRLEMCIEPLDPSR
jgi:hypothetical protein